MSSSTSEEPHRPSRKPLQNFRIRWNQATQVFSAIKTAWAREQRPPDNNTVPLLRWIYRGRDDTVRNPGEKFCDLFFSKLDIGDDHEWHYDHALGRGGYGAVALFNKVDANTGTIKDEVVIKTVKATTRDAVDEDRPDLSKEAALMGQTNDLEEDGMLFLRQFKSYHADAKQWRYYLEHCPYGDLERLRVRYKAYGRYLPELFLWHLFAWLVTSAHEYSEYNDWRHIDTEHWGETVTDGFLLHSDIKTHNIVLGVPDPDATVPFDLYPTPRIADLGLAEVQSEHNSYNNAPSLAKGTPNWMPPELRWQRVNSRNDFNPFRLDLDPNRENIYRKGDFQITSKANIWAIGAVMFSMTTLHEPEVLSDMVNYILDQHLPVPAEGESVIDNVDFKILDPQYYSLELRDLIKDCVRLHWNDRPTEKEVMNRATDAYANHLQTLRNMGYEDSLQETINSHPDYRVYYRENEIDSAPDNYQFTHPGCNRRWFERYFVDEFPWIPPSWGNLWPRTMPMDTAAPRNWSTEMKNAFHERKLRAQLAALSIAANAGSAVPHSDTDTLGLHGRVRGASQQQVQFRQALDRPIEDVYGVQPMDIEMNENNLTQGPRTAVGVSTPRAGWTEDGGEQDDDADEGDEDEDEDEDDEETEQAELGPVRANRLWTDRYHPYHLPYRDSQNHWHY